MRENAEYYIAFGGSQAHGKHQTMQENAEYCTGQEFQVVFILKMLGKRLWQCKQCAYQFAQPLAETEPPSIPAYHPKPIPMRFTVSEEQMARLKASLNKNVVEDRTDDL